MNSEIKKHSSGSVLWAVLVMPLLLNDKVSAADNVIFTGDLVAEACSLRPGDDAITLDMSDVSSQYLYANSRTVGKRFRIHLEGCDTRISDAVTTTFSGRESIELPGLLKLDASSVAAGIALGIETPANVPLLLNATSDEQSLSDGNNIIEFKAFIKGEPRALADKTIRAGAFAATSTFILSYP